MKILYLILLGLIYVVLGSLNYKFGMIAETLQKIEEDLDYALAALPHQRLVEYNRN